MMARSCSDEAWALMLDLVQHHVRSKVDKMLRQRDPNDVPSWNAIGSARTEFLRSNPDAPRHHAPARKMPVQQKRLVEPKPSRPPLTFDEKLARVAAGARLITVRPLRKADPDYTLGGVASASL